MTTIVTRLGKGLPLTYAEMDANLTNLNNDKVEVTTFAAHLTNPTDAHDASAISLLDTGNYFTSATVEGALAEIGASGVSFSYFTQSRNITAPNATVPAHSFSVNGAEVNIDAVFSPKGTGAILAQVPNGTLAGGNKRGNNAV